eukprot:SAG31_NODE_26_length_32985_cov_39.054096_20_plen_1883_part_00
MHGGLFYLRVHFVYRGNTINLFFKKISSRDDARDGRGWLKARALLEMLGLRHLLLFVLVCGPRRRVPGAAASSKTKTDMSTKRQLQACVDDAAGVLAGIELDCTFTIENIGCTADLGDADLGAVSWILGSAGLTGLVSAVCPVSCSTCPGQTQGEGTLRCSASAFVVDIGEVESWLPNQAAVRQTPPPVHYTRNGRNPVPWDTIASRAAYLYSGTTSDKANSVPFDVAYSNCNSSVPAGVDAGAFDVVLRTDLPPGVGITIFVIATEEFQTQVLGRWGGDCPGTNQIRGQQHQDYPDLRCPYLASQSASSEQYGGAMEWTNDQNTTQPFYYTIDGAGAFTVGWVINDPTACGLGQYDHDADATTPCQGCPQGRYSNSTGGTSCTSCPAGTCWSGLNDLSGWCDSMGNCGITSTSSGWMERTPETKECSPDGLMEPYQLLSNGRRELGASTPEACMACPAGKFDHDLDPATSCQTCPGGTYTNYSGNTACTICPFDRGGIASPGSTSVDACDFCERFEDCNGTDGRFFICDMSHGISGTCELCQGQCGCTDTLAANFDAEMVYDDGSCDYAPLCSVPVADCLDDGRGYLSPLRNPFSINGWDSCSNVASGRGPPGTSCESLASEGLPMSLANTLEAMGNVSIRAKDICPVSCSVGNCGVSSVATSCVDDTDGLGAIIGLGEALCPVLANEMPGGCDGDLSRLLGGPFRRLRDLCPLSCGDCETDEAAVDTSSHTVCFPGEFRAFGACSDDPDGYLEVIGGCGAAVVELGCDYNMADSFHTELANGTLMRHVCRITCGGCQVDAFVFTEGAKVSNPVVPCLPGTGTCSALAVTDHHFRVRGARNQRTVINGAEFSNLRQTAIFAHPSAPKLFQSQSTWIGAVIVDISWTKFFNNSACVDEECTSGRGGAILATAVTLLVKYSEFEFNTAHAGGGICMDATVGNSAGVGGSDFQGDASLSIASSRFVYSNIAVFFADVDVTSTMIVGPGPTNVCFPNECDESDQAALYVSGRLNLTMTNVTLRAGHAVPETVVPASDQIASEFRVQSAQDTDLLVPALLYAEGILSAKISDTTFKPFTNGETVLLGLLGGCDQHPCNPGYACEYAEYSLSCTACPSPTVGTDGVICMPCPAGHGPNANGTRCERCAGNNASSTGTCHPCPAGTVASEDRYVCNDVSLPNGGVTDVSVALAVLSSTNLLPRTTFQLQIDDIDTVTVPGPANDALTTNLRQDIALALSIDVSLLKVSGIRPVTRVTTAGRRALQAGSNVAFDVEIAGAAAASVQHMENLKQQLLNPVSALRTSSTGGSIDATVTPRFSFVCPAGLMRELGASACVSCIDRSTYTDTGQTCKPCPNHQIPNGIGDGCTCKDNFYDSSAGRLVCYAEGEDFQLSDLQNVGAVSENDRCQPCDLCLTCVGGVSFINSGFALSETARLALPATQDVLSAPAAIFACPLDGCLGQAQLGGNESQTAASRHMARCKIGYEGPLCAVCKQSDTEKFVQSSGACVDCSGTEGISKSAFMLLCAFVLLAVCTSITCCARKRLSRASKGESQNRGAGLPGLVGDEQAEELIEANNDGGVMVQGKILIGLIQIISELPSALSITYPKAFANLIDYMKIFFLDVFEFFALDCVSPLNLHLKFMIIMALPPIASTFIRLLRFIADQAAQRSSESPEVVSERITRNGNKAAYRTFFVVFLLCKCDFSLRIVCRARFSLRDTKHSCTCISDPLLSRTAFHMMPTSCRFLAEDESWHVDDYSIDCGSGTHAFFVIIAVIFIVLYPIGIPVTFLLLLRRDAAQNTKKIHTTPEQAYTVSKLKTQRTSDNGSFDFLKKEYREQCYYFETVVLVEKLLLSGLLVFVDQGSVFQCFAGSCVAFVFCGVQVVTWPCKL